MFLLAYFTPHLLLIFDMLCVCVGVVSDFTYCYFFSVCVNVSWDFFGVCIYIYLCVQFIFHSTLV